MERPFSSLFLPPAVRTPLADVRFIPESGHHSARSRCPLCAKSGLMQCNNWTMARAIPATSVLGTIILTGFLGGAVTSHLRVAGTLTPEMIVSLNLGVTAWCGLWSRDVRIRALIPRRQNVVHSAALADASRSGNRAIS
jgi:hypothetical protein